MPVKYDYDYAHSKEDVTLKQNWKCHRTLVLVFYKFAPELLQSIISAFLTSLNKENLSQDIMDLQLGIIESTKI